MRHSLLSAGLAVIVGLLIINITYALNCKKISQMVFDRGSWKGLEMRIVHGWSDNGTPHRWTEYFKDGKWRVWDEASWMVGKSWFTAEELGYKVREVRT